MIRLSHPGTVRGLTGVLAAVLFAAACSSAATVAPATGHGSPALAAVFATCGA